MKKLLVLTAALLFPLAVFAQDWKGLSNYDKAKVKESLTTRFTKYVTYDTQSKENATAVPSTKGQTVFAKALAKELKKLGASNVKTDKNGFVTAEIPGNTRKPAPVIGLIAHMDTAAEESGKDVKPQVHKNYQGGDIVINQAMNLVINPGNSPQLGGAKGHDIVTASGGTLLGADDKTGVAIIMTVVEYLLDHPQIEHGTVKIAFTPDEEVGGGIELFDTAAFGADYAYTLDGGNIGELTAENFNAKGFTAIFEGNRGVHTGAAYNSDFADNTMMSADFRTLLPRHQRPETTMGRKGFIYPDLIVEDGNTSKVTGLIRSFSQEEMDQLVASVQSSFDTVKAMYPKAKNMSLTFKDQYRNMKEKIPQEIISVTENAMRFEDITPVLDAARGGTDGANLSYMGLPTPDIFAGMFNIHSQTEYADVDVMEASLRTVISALTLWAKQPAPEK